MTQIMSEQTEAEVKAAASAVREAAAKAGSFFYRLREGAPYFVALYACIMRGDAPRDANVSCQSLRPGTW